MQDEDTYTWRETPEDIIRLEEELYCDGSGSSNPIAQQRCVSIKHAIKKLEALGMIAKKNHEEAKSI